MGKFQDQAGLLDWSYKLYGPIRCVLCMCYLIQFVKTLSSS